MMSALIHKPDCPKRQMARVIKGVVAKGYSIELAIVLDDGEELSFEEHAVPKLDLWLGNVVASVLSQVTEQLTSEDIDCVGLQLTSRSKDVGEHPCQVTELSLSLTLPAGHHDRAKSALKRAADGNRDLGELLCSVELKIEN